MADELDPLVEAPPANTQSPVRRWLVHGVKALIGVALVAYLLNAYDAAEVGRGIAGANLWDILLACVWGALSLYCFALMYRVSMRKLDMPITALSIMKIQLQIRFYALFMPGSANLFVKWYKFAKPGKQPAQALLVMAFTRVLLTVSMLALALVGVMGDALFPWDELRLYLLVGLLLSLACFFMLTSKRIAALFEPILQWPWPGASYAAPLRKRVAKLLTISKGFQTFSKSQIIALLALSILGSVFQSLQLLALAHAVGLPIGLLTMLWLRGVSQMVAMIPISISGLGLREASMVAILIGYGVSEPEALSFSLLIFAVVIVGKGLVGGVLEAWEQFGTPRKEAT